MLGCNLHASVPPCFNNSGGGPNLTRFLPFQIAERRLGRHLLYFAAEPSTPPLRTCPASLATSSHCTVLAWPSQSVADGRHKTAASLILGTLPTPCERSSPVSDHLSPAPPHSHSVVSAERSIAEVVLIHDDYDYDDTPIPRYARLPGPRSQVPARSPEPRTSSTIIGCCLMSPPTT